MVLTSNKPLALVLILIYYYSLGITTLHAQLGLKDSLLLEVKHYRSISKNQNEKKQYIDILNQLAYLYKNRTTDSVRIFAEESLRLSKDLNYAEGKILAILRLGDYYSETGLDIKALKNYKIAIKLASQLNDPSILVAVLKSKAMREDRSFQLSESLLTYYKAIEVARNNDLIEAEAELRHNLGFLFFNYDLFNEAHEEYLIADSLWSVKKDLYKKAITRSNMVLNAVNKGDFKLVDMFLDKSILAIEEHNAQPIWLSRAYRAKSKYYFKKDSLKKSLVWLIKSDNILTNLINKREQLDIDLLYSNIYTSMGALKPAKKYTLKTLKSALLLKDSTNIAQAYYNLSVISSQKGNLDSAYVHLNKSEQLKNRFQAVIKRQQLGLLRSKKNFELDKRKIILESENKIVKQQLYARLSIIGLVFVILVALLLVKSNNKEKKLNLKLANQTSTLELKQAELNKINENQDKLFSIVGHDLRGPIVSLKQILALALENNTDIEHFYTFGPKLKKDVDHIHFTLDNLLSWGVTQMQGKPLNPIKIDVVKQMTEIIEFFEDTSQKKSINISISLANTSFIVADANHFNIIFRNLISNAIKFTGENGEIWINSKKEGDTLVISIIDNGVGMSDEIINRVLNQSEHYTTYGTNNERGTGLGLVLCQEMVAKNNGSITAESVSGKGTSFFIRFPISS